MKRKITSLLLAAGAVAIGVAVIEGLAYLGWTLGGEFGRQVGLAVPGYAAVALIVLLWVQLVGERRTRSARVRWVWSRRDVVGLVVRGFAVAPARVGVLDVAHGPCWDGAGWFPPRARRAHPEISAVAADEPLAEVPVVTVEV
jgi:hypothetical protein